MASKKTPIKEVEETLEAPAEVEVKEVKKKKGDKYDPMELVPAFYFKDNGKYKDDITVGYNGRFFKIRRGVEVMVPRVVDEIIKQSMAQDLQSAMYQERLQNEFAEASKKYD